MRRVPKPRDPILFSLLAVALLSVIVSAAYFTRSQDIRDGLSGKEVVHAQIVMQYDEPGAEGKSVWRSLCTSSPTQIRELMTIMQKYPYNRKPDLSKIGVGRFYTQPTTTMWVTLSCSPENGKNIWAQELWCTPTDQCMRLFPTGICSRAGWGASGPRVRRAILRNFRIFTCKRRKVRNGALKIIKSFSRTHRMSAAEKLFYTEKH